MNPRSKDSQRARPALMPNRGLAGRNVYNAGNGEMVWSVVIEESDYPMSELDLELVSPNIDGPLRFRIVAEDRAAELELELFEDQEGPNYRFVVRAGGNAKVRLGERAEADDAIDFFYDNPPMIWFHDGSGVEDNDFIPLKTTHPPYEAARILDWDWTGVGIRKES